jgi:hypothetical protein
VRNPDQRVSPNGRVPAGTFIVDLVGSYWRISVQRLSGWIKTYRRIAVQRRSGSINRIGALRCTISADGRKMLRSHAGQLLTAIAETDFK